MLETKDLCKQYKPKKGVPVQAVDRVSLRFPEKGMVFLLGKSGSGKSTLLNLLGGLDRADSGEIIIKGVSSGDFRAEHFDSYRNTYVGFIFQEYNVLEEFTVGANIALALELQGRSADDAELNKILTAVDLAGFGERKPNELSGGQKQRVAIARALVKDPQIIMADEPTGALDSNTGRQVLDTLKKLSAEKLVIVVSHDREYAAPYADRIIELADGKVIRDVEAQRSAAAAAEKQLVFRASTVEIPADYHLTEEDRVRINDYLDKLRTGATLTLPERSQQFADTDESKIPVQDGSGFHLIKSRLPLPKAFRIGCSSLKHKRLRLVFTILLSVAAFTLFSLVDTFSSYHHVQACTDSLIDSGVSFFSVNKAVRHGSGQNEWWDIDEQRISEADLEEISAQTGENVTGLFIPAKAELGFSQHYNVSHQFGEGRRKAYFSHFCGFAEVTPQTAEDLHFKLIAGAYPDGSRDEIALSSVLCDTFVQAGYRKTEGAKLETIAAPKDMIGKTLTLMGTDFTVTGIIDTGMDMNRYHRLKEDDSHSATADEMVNYMLYREFLIASNYSLSGCAMTGSGRVQKMIAAEPKIYRAGSIQLALFHEDETFCGNCYPTFYTTLDRVPESEILWLDGKKDHLEENEIILPLAEDCLYFHDNTMSQELFKRCEALITQSNDMAEEEIHKLLTEITDNWSMELQNYAEMNPDLPEAKDCRIVGCILPKSQYGTTAVLPEGLAATVIPDTDGIYDSAVGAMPESESGVRKLVQFCYPEGDTSMRYALNDPAIYELETVNGILKVLAKVFLYIGIGFAVFALLLMANFISSSIHYKRQEIGILRAIGARSNDVFRIFFSESFVIAMIHFVLSSALGFGLVTLINTVLRTRSGILITVLHFGIRQILLLFVICVGGAALASFLPVRRIAAKKPIDAIRNK